MGDSPLHNNPELVLKCGESSGQSTFKASIRNQQQVRDDLIPLGFTDHIPTMD